MGALVTLVTGMPQENIFFHVFWVLKQLFFNNSDVPIYLLFSVNGNMSSHVVFIQLNPTSCLSQDFQTGWNVQMVHQWELWLRTEVHWDYGF